MAKIENLRPALKPGQWSVLDTTITFSPNDGAGLAIELPYEALNFVKLLNGAYSVSEIIRHLYQKKVNYRYQSLVKTLKLLADNNLFKNNEDVRLHMTDFGENNYNQHHSNQKYDKEFFSKDRIISLLKRTPIGHKTLPKAMDLILKHSKLVNFKEKDIIVRSGNLEKELYVLLSGSVGVLSPKDDKGFNHVMAQLEPVTIFGESSAAFDKPITADVVALEDSWLLSIEIQKIVDVKKPASFDSYRPLRTRLFVNQILLEAPLFQGIPSDALQVFTSKCQLNAMDKDTVVIEQGEAIDIEDPETPSFYFIIKGEVSVIKDGKWVCDLKRGDYFGEIASLGANFRTATVKTNNQECSFLTISARNLNDILSENLALALALEKIADQRAEVHLTDGETSGVDIEKDSSIVTEASFIEKHAFFEEQDHFAGIEDIEIDDLSSFDFSVQQLDDEEES